MLKKHEKSEKTNNGILSSVYKFESQTPNTDANANANVNANLSNIHS